MTSPPFRCTPSVAILIAVSLLTGCQTDSDTTRSNPTTAEPVQISSRSQLPAQPAPDKTVAQVNGYPIEQGELDQHIRFQLHDLEWQAYQLRQAALQRLIEQQNQQQGITRSEVINHLSPPIPPLTELPKSTLAAKGPASAPITVSVFCSFQSPHCQRMQPVFKALAEQYPHQLQFAHYDYPLSFHRNARPAANAARCANQQGKFWPYASALYAHQDDLTPTRFLSIAEQLNIKTPTFEHCLNDLSFKNAVEQDVAFGEQLGLGNVPVTFINGLYIKGPVPLATLKFYTDYALAQQGLPQDQTPASIVRSPLPLRLVAINESNDPQHSTVVIEYTDTQSQQIFRQNQPIQFDQAFSVAPLLVAIEDDRIVLNHLGRLSFLPLQTSTSPSNDQEIQDTQLATSATSSSLSSTTAQHSTSWQTYPERRFNEGHRELPVTSITPLSRAWLDEQLANQSQLERHFQTAEHQVEGQSLMKLRNITDQEFYRTLGLQDNDVVLRVNDQWLHDGQNSLWDTLKHEQEVSLQLMRNGLPVRYDYSIQ